MEQSNFALMDVIESEDQAQSSRAENPERTDDYTSTSDYYKTVRLNSVVITSVMNEFVLDEAQKQDVRDCAEEMIQGNGAEWVWKNRDMLLDLLEFHGYARKCH